MNNSEKKFFEEYKRLDSLCKDLLMKDSGVSAYIKEMEEVSFYDRKSVPSWDNDLKMLKKVRHIRNIIAHEDVEIDFADNDIDFIRNFSQRILCQTDPFSYIRRYKQYYSRKGTKIETAEEYQCGPNGYNRNVVAAGLLIGVVAVTILIGFILLI